jgi:carbonic anhydrase
MPDVADITSTFDDVLEANARYAETFALGHLEPRAERGLAIVTCFDSRIEPLAMLGLAPGDAKILRTAGGRIGSSEVNSLSLASERLGVSRIAVVHHTECAAPGITPEALRADVASICADQRMQGLVVCGMRYDVRTGRLDLEVPPVRA